MGTMLTVAASSFIVGVAATIGVFILVCIAVWKDLRG